MSRLTHLGMTTNKRLAQGLLKFPFSEVSQPTKLLRKRPRRFWGASSNRVKITGVLYAMLTCQLVTDCLGM